MTIIFKQRVYGTVKCEYSARLVHLRDAISYFGIEQKLH